MKASKVTPDHPDTSIDTNRSHVPASEQLTTAPYRNAISIEIKGITGAGKTLFVELLANFLTDLGQQVKCVDWHDFSWVDEADQRDINNPDSHHDNSYFLSNDSGKPMPPLLCSPILITASNAQPHEISEFFIRHNFTDVCGGRVRKLSS